MKFHTAGTAGGRRSADYLVVEQTKSCLGRAVGVVLNMIPHMSPSLRVDLSVCGAQTAVADPP